MKITYFEYEGGIKDPTPRTAIIPANFEPPCGRQEPDCDQHEDDGPSFRAQYVKRKRFETQRAKPWHIVRPGSEVLADVLCGAYKNYGIHCTIASWMEAAEARPSEVAPTIYDLLALCEDLSRTHPVQARAAIAKLKWLMKMSTRQTGTSWDHPWESNR